MWCCNCNATYPNDDDAMAKNNNYNNNNLGILERELLVINFQLEENIKTNFVSVFYTISLYLFSKKMPQVWHDGIGLPAKAEE